MPSSSPGLASGSTTSPTVAGASASSTLLSGAASSSVALGAGLAAATAFAVDLRSTLWRLRYGATFKPRFDDVSTPDFTVVPTGDGDVMIGGTGFEIGGNATIYVGAFADQTEGDAQVALPACTLTNLNVRRSVGAGTTTYTVRKNGSDTALTVTLSGSTTTGSSGASVSFAAGDLFTVKIVASGGASAYHSYGVTATPA